jgi:hypothetical protein
MGGPLRDLVYTYEYIKKKNITSIQMIILNKKT